MRAIRPSMTAAVMLIAVGALAGCASTSGQGSPANSVPASGAPSVSPKNPAVDEMTSIPKECLEASEVSALVAYQVSAPIVSSDTDSLSCTYTASTDYAKTIEINLQKAPSGTTAATLEAQAKHTAPSNMTVTPVTGFGQAAFTLSGGTGVSILVWSGDVEFSVSGQTTLQGVELVAKDVLAG